MKTIEQLLLFRFVGRLPERRLNQEESYQSGDHKCPDYTGYYGYGHGQNILDAACLLVNRLAFERILLPDCHV